jgi:hypothetical protein
MIRAVAEVPGGKPSREGKAKSCLYAILGLEPTSILGV